MAREFPGTYPGTISAPPHVPPLVRSADVVVLGTVVAVRDVEQVSYRVGDRDVQFVRRMASLEPERRFKGAPADGPLEIELLATAIPSSLTSLHRGERVVLFLKQDGDHFALVDLVTSKIDAGEIGSPASRARRALEEAAAADDAEVASIAGAILRSG